MRPRGYVRPRLAPDISVHATSMAAICTALVFLLLSSPLCSWGLPRRGREGMLRAPARPEGIKLAPAQWFQQKLDHFNPSDTRMWKQRFFVNDTNWDRSNGPVFLSLGGEGEADPVWIAVNTDMMRNAEKYKALAVMIEHRYYGQSHPTPNVSTENLKYLSSRQAVEDIVTFHNFFTAQYNLTSSNKWVSFGGSYSGALSAWLRLKHPEVVVGAVATSGPVQAVVDFSQYLEVVNDSLATSAAGVWCDKYIGIASDMLDDMIRNQEWQKLEKLFHVDPPLQSSLDAQLLAQDLIGNFMGVVQYNRDNTAFEGRPNNITLDDLCTIMANDSIPSALDRFVAVNNLLLNSTGEKTINASFQGQVDFMKQVDWDAPTNMGDRQWTYQTCSEFGYFQTTDSAKQPFGSSIPLDSYTKVCSLVYNLSSDSVGAAVSATNAYYGGKNLPKNATNIIFPNGSIDPWHALGITSNISDSLIAIFITGTAHCANMYPPRDSDLPGLISARQEISQIIGQWLSQ